MLWSERGLWTRCCTNRRQRARDNPHEGRRQLTATTETKKGPQSGGPQIQSPLDARAGRVSSLFKVTPRTPIYNANLRQRVGLSQTRCVARLRSLLALS